MILVRGEKSGWGARGSGQRCIRHILPAVVACACSGLLLAQTPEIPQDLYLDALQSIAEGRQNDASEALRRMIEKEPQHAGAWLDLALTQCELGHAEEAERLFQTIIKRFAPPPVLLDLIARRRAQGCHGWQPQSQLSVSVGRGADSNLNQGASNPAFSIGNGDYRVDLQLLPEYQPQRDQYTALAMEYWRSVTANGALGFVQFQAQRNDSLFRYNTASLIGGMDLPWRWGSWNMRSTGSLALLSLGGKPYQAQSQVQTQMAHAFGERMQLGLAANIAHASYKTLNDFDSNTGELRSFLNYRTNRALTQASLSYLADRALGQRPGGDRHGWLARLNGRTSLSENVFGELGWSRQFWQSKTPYSPGIIDQTRHQQIQILRSALGYQFTPQQSLILELRAVRNDENISIFKYNDDQIKISWKWQQSP
ncbi:MAG: tetratricopeptide repeat protein [Sterolibacterium sp.]|nr:tetratricopeptide repeat protein [Sterolibacterium sp.]